MGMMEKKMETTIIGYVHIRGLEFTGLRIGCNVSLGKSTVPLEPNTLHTLDRPVELLAHHNGLGRI